MSNSTNPNMPPIGDLVGMLQWCQDHVDDLTEEETWALFGPLMRAAQFDPSAPITFIGGDYERHADLWDVVLRLAEKYELVPADES